MVWVWLGLLFGAAIGSLGGFTGILLGALIGVAAGSLAYGSATVPPNGLSIASIVPGYEATTSARERPTFTIAAAAEPHTLGGEAKLGPPVDWKTWSLWAALVLAVAALGFMAWRLSQQAAEGAIRAKQRIDRRNRMFARPPDRGQVSSAATSAGSIAPDGPRRT